MLNSGRIVGLTYMQSIRCYGCGDERGVQWFTSYSLPSKRWRGTSMWVMHGFEFHLYLYLSLSWSPESVCVICLLLIWAPCRDFYLLYRFSLLIGSDWVFFVFYREGHGLAKKLLMIIFIFWQISSTFRYALILCVETPFLHIEESLGTDSIWWMLSWAVVAIITLCVRWIRKRSFSVI